MTSLLDDDDVIFVVLSVLLLNEDVIDVNSGGIYVPKNRMCGEKKMCNMINCC